MAEAGALMAAEDRDIAIVGISVFSPAGDSVGEFWEGISRGGDFITEAPPEVIESYYFEGKPNRVDHFYCSRGGFGKAFRVDPLRYGILPVAADGVEPDQFVSMIGVEQALDDAGVFEKEISLQNCSFIIGKGNFSGLVPLRTLEILRTARQVTALLKSALPELSDQDLIKIRRAYQKRQGRYQADMAIGTMPNLVASLVANRFDMHGPAYTVDAACASGILAIDHSIGLLRSGQCNLAVAGGMHTTQNAMFWGAFDLLGALSRRQQIAPFSKNADGLLIGQGCGFIVLKTLRRAIEDGDRIYAVIKETAVSSDGTGSHVTVTSVAGEVRVLEKAWGRAGMDPKAIGHIEAHGTATPVGDRVEITALKEFFGDNKQRPALVGSIKSNIGHAMPAAGMMGIIKMALALYHRKIPPTLHCEDPLPLMRESRFLPPQEPIDWDGERYPLVAGVNAFGFGGINSHAILTPYEPAPGMPPQPRPKPWLGEAIMLSAPDQQTLIAKLEKGDYTNTGGSYRLVMFSPDESRIEKAIAIVKRDKPWRGRIDIWFSNKPLLEGEGKVAFMCPGFGPEAILETDSLSVMFDFPFMDTMLETQSDVGYTKTSLQYYLTAWMCKEGLSKLGVEADLYLGHSVGEWNAATFAGMIEGDWEKAYNAMFTWGELGEYPLLAVSGTDVKTVEGWCAEIPDLYLSNDNCPSQILLCGTPDAVKTLTARLSEEQIFHTELPYGSGFHTPLMTLSEKSHRQLFEELIVKEGHAPVWSSTTLAPLPSDQKKYQELAQTHLTQPVHFRSLIEKLYEEETARVFVQIGYGALAGFVEDTLKGREFSVITSTSNTRGGADQLRRVLAALFVEGREVDVAYLGVKPMYRVEHELITLQRGAPPVIAELPELSEVVSKHYARAAYPALAPSEDEKAGGNPLLAAVSANMREATKVQSELVQLFEQTPPAPPVAVAAGAEAVVLTQTDRRRVARGAAAAAAAAATVATTSAGKPTRNTRFANTALPPNFEERVCLTFEDHPYLVDHSIVRQPDGWPTRSDLNLVVPFTMTIELLAEIAMKRAGGRRLISISKVAAYRWISLENPFEETATGVWKSPDVLELTLDGYAKAEICFGDACPEPPAEYLDDIDIGERIMDNPSPDVLYDLYSFHGPQYHSNTKMTKIGSRGMRGYAMKRAGKGSLLDIMGQGLGLFLHLTQTRNTISFPVRLKELCFYADIFDQEGTFEHTMVVTHLTSSSVTANMVLKRDGKVWSVAREFVCQRFENVIPIWNVILKPQCSSLAEELAPGVYYYLSTSQDNILGLLGKRYLNSVDREESDRLGSMTRKREYLISRLVLKDAVRDFARLDSGEMLYPVEVFCGHDENGRPFVFGHDRAREILEGVQVSLSHKGNEAVALVGTEPGGIDLERIEEKSDGFLEVAFTERERELLATLPQPEGAIRFWVAKEASAKKCGTGLEGNPKRFEVTAVDGDVLFVGDQKVRTMRKGEENVVGWTI
jgi:acyl transferase domain-containing protein/phosphopantetheinyl transferase